MTIRMRHDHVPRPEGNSGEESETGEKSLEEMFVDEIDRGLS
jgi:hypothetical protein